MLIRFFIDRPIFASVPSIIITLAGLAAVLSLPVAQYPEIAPPTVQVSCGFPGASAVVVSDTIAAPIEQQVNGVENMLYMSSTCGNDGSYALTVTFRLGTNLDMAQVLVQNRVALALPGLPEIVKQTGVTTKKRSPDVLLVVNLNSPKDSVIQRDQLYLSNYATIQVRDELARLPGVGDVTIFGQQDYSMRVWLDPEKMQVRGLTANDVLAAIREQNMQVAAGQVGQPPMPAGQNFQFTISTLGRLREPEQFADIIIKTGGDDTVVRLRDIARIELGAKNQDQICTLDSRPSAGIAIFQSPGSNALSTADGVRRKMRELKTRFPEGVEYGIVYDTTPFIRESIAEVIHALRDAVILVAIVVLIFLQSWRATIIPLVAVPVAVIGTFAVMAAMGYSLNNISLLGLVLAVGIVVDDAIVVVEAVEHKMQHGATPREAAHQAMAEVASPIIAISLVLTAVFVPCAFIAGITGQFFRQFALTIAVATLISAVNSLTLSPALCAILLKPRNAKRDPLTWLIDLLLGWFFKLFNAVFGVGTNVYTWVVGRSLRLSAIVLVLYGGLLYLTYVQFLRVPGGFIPEQDKGYLVAAIQLPDSASAERTREVLARADRIAMETPGVAHTVAIGGQSFVFGAAGSNYASMFIILDEFHNRHDSAKRANAIAAQLRNKFFARIPEAMALAFGAPPVSGLGNAGGFKIMIQDRGNVGLTMLQEQTDNFAEKGPQLPQVAAMAGTFRAHTPQLYLDLDRVRCKTLGIPLSDVFTALQVYLGGNYVNDFNQFGRTWQVNLQAEAPFRRDASAIGALKVRTAHGDMVPLGSIARIEEVSGPSQITRYNMYPAAAINGVPAPGVSSGEVIRAVESLAQAELSRSLGYEWTEITLLQLMAGNSAVYVFAGAVLLVFLILAAQYESWSMPLSVILVVPMCILSSLTGVMIAHSDLNIFTQIGLVVLVGLACKNAILIVEFAKTQRESGKNAFDAAIEACRLRLRPILMTSFTFILGVLPLMLAAGAGAEMRRALGVAVFAGMLGVTLFGVVLTPVFYFVIDRLTSRASATGSRTAARTQTLPH